MDIEKEIELIKERNKKVEVDKAWEVSSMRRLIIMVFTYATSVAWLIVIGADNPWLVAFVPAGGYILSTFSLPIVKTWWIKVNHSYVSNSPQ